MPRRYGGRNVKLKEMLHTEAKMWYNMREGKVSMGRKERAMHASESESRNIRVHTRVMKAEGFHDFVAYFILKGERYEKNH